MVTASGPAEANPQISYSVEPNCFDLLNCFYFTELLTNIDITSEQLNPLSQKSDNVISA